MTRVRLRDARASYALPEVILITMSLSIVVMVIVKLTVAAVVHRACRRAVIAVSTEPLKLPHCACGTAAAESHSSNRSGSTAAGIKLPAHTRECDDCWYPGMEHKGHLCKGRRHGGAASHTDHTSLPDERRDPAGRRQPHMVGATRRGSHPREPAGHARASRPPTQKPSTGRGARQRPQGARGIHITAPTSGRQEQPPDEQSLISSLEQATENATTTQPPGRC